jgi:predicted nucleic acid-binding Zn ribbon protein
MSAAARARQQDRTRAVANAVDPLQHTCPVCGTPIDNRYGQPKRYCNRTCQLRARRKEYR